MLENVLFSAGIKPKLEAYFTEAWRESVARFPCVSFNFYEIKLQPSSVSSENFYEILLHEKFRSWPYRVLTL